MIALSFGMIYIAIALTGSLLAGWIDLKTTEIPDSITFGMIFLGLLIHGIESYVIGSIDPFILSLTITLFFAAFSLIMYFSGMWGGGDGALLTGIGALLANYGMTVGYMPFPIVFLVTVFGVGFVYSTLYMFVFAVSTPGIRKDFAQKIRTDKLSIDAMILGFLFLGYSVFARMDFMFVAPITVLLMLPIFAKFTKSVEENFYMNISTKELREGDMLGENIPKLGLFKHHIRGLTKQEVLKIRKKMKTVIIREGIRYGPVFFLSLLVLIATFGLS
jgi:Flp pilus assembly protein protease CpaA